MAWVEFSAPFKYRPTVDRRVMIKYRPGWRGLVPTACARQAVAAGVAVRVASPPRTTAPADPPAEGA